MSHVLFTDTLREDTSFPSPELQLRFRIEDLFSRLYHLQTSAQINDIGDPSIRYSDEELRYAPCARLFRESDVLRALELCYEEIPVPESGPESQVLPGQIAFDFAPARRAA